MPNQSTTSNPVRVSPPHWTPRAAQARVTDLNQRLLSFLPPFLASSSISGATAGILGLTSLPGFAFYLLSALFTGYLLTLRSTNSPTLSLGEKGSTGGKEFVVGGVWELIAGGLLENVFGFVLFWTREFVVLLLQGLTGMRWDVVEEMSEGRRGS